MKLTHIYAALLVLVLMACGPSSESEEGSPSVVTPSATPCFGAGRLVEAGPANNEDAVRLAREIGVELPILEGDSNLSITGASVLDGGDVSGLVLFLSTSGADWPTARVRLTPLVECDPPERDDPASVVDQVPVYFDGRGVIVRYVAPFRINETFVEASMSWLVDSAPEQHAQLQFVSEWIAELLVKPPGKD